MHGKREQLISFLINYLIFTVHSWSLPFLLYKWDYAVISCFKHKLQCPCAFYLMCQTILGASGFFDPLVNYSSKSFITSSIGNVSNVSWNRYESRIDEQPIFSFSLLKAKWLYFFPQNSISFKGATTFSITTLSKKALNITISA